MSATRRKLYWLSSSVFLRTMPFQPLAMAAMMKLAGLGSESLNTTVFLSGVVISSTVANSGARGMLTPAGGLRIRSNVALTSSDVNSAPSWNSTSLRRWKV
jgi:hypothetical protein